MNQSKIILVLVAAFYFIGFALPLVSEIPDILSENTRNLVIVNFGGLSISRLNVFIIKIFLILLSVTIMVIIQYIQIFRPFNKFKEIRENMFNTVFEPQLDKIRKDSVPDLRFAILKKKTYLNLFNICMLIKLFPIFNSGYKYQELDNSLSFWIIKFFKYKNTHGLPGIAAMNKKLYFGNYKSDTAKNSLTKRQADLLMGLELVMCFPILTNSNKSSAGVLCIDTKNTEAADNILKNDEQRDKYFDYFWNCSKLISYVI